jgi:signal transduction histidine kinase
MNIYSLPPLFCSLLAIFLGLFVYSHNKKSQINISFALLCLSTFWWQFSWCILFNTHDKSFALYLIKVGYTGIIFIPFTFYHFVASFLNLKKEKRTVFLFYVLSAIFILSVWTTNYFVSGCYNYFWGYYPKANFFHLIYLFFLFFSATRGLLFIVNSIKIKKETLSPSLYNQLRYSFVSFIIYALSATDFLVNYGIEFYPLGFIPVILSLAIFAYTIVRYRLMDISVAVTRTGVFIAVYTLVLGLPFALAGRFKDRLIDIFGTHWWKIPLGLMAILATAGPFIYIYVQRKAEERLLREQKRYQDVLRQASVGMTRIRNLRKLLNLITHIVTKTVKISYVGIYLYNQETDEYVLQVSRDKGRMPIPKLNFDNPLISWIAFKREPLVYEEIKRQMQDFSDPIYKHLEENMRLLTASVLLPSFLEDKFMGFIVLGDKMTGQIYTPDDLDVFQILASQAALAIENAQFYEEAKEMQGQIAQAEKMATIGTMADGLSHQINNRFHALSLIAGDTIDTIKLTDTSKCTPEVKEMITQINHALERVQANVIQGSEVVKGILKYSRKGQEGFEPLSIDQILDATLEMVQYKVKLSDIDIVRDYPKDTPKIKGNLTQMEEVFFNFIDNAYDAIMERRELLKENGYRGRITVGAHPKDSKLEIVIEDNGLGIKDENDKKMFTPFFTTKTSSRKGTGLGLYVIKRIITDSHQGRITFESDYKVGTRFIVELPIAK